MHHQLTREEFDKVRAGGPMLCFDATSPETRVFLKNDALYVQTYIKHLNSYVYDELRDTLTQDKTEFIEQVKRDSENWKFSKTGREFFFPEPKKTQMMPVAEAKNILEAEFDRLSESEPMSDNIPALEVAINALEFAEIFERAFTKDALELLSDKDEFTKWLERVKWTAKRIDQVARELEEYKRLGTISDMEKAVQKAKEYDEHVEKISNNQQQSAPHAYYKTIVETFKNITKNGVAPNGVVPESAYIQSITNIVNAYDKEIAELDAYRELGTVEGYKTALNSSLEYYNLMKEYKSKLSEYQELGTVEDFEEALHKAELHDEYVESVVTR